MKKLQLSVILFITIVSGFAIGAYAQNQAGTQAQKITIDKKGGIYNHDGTLLGTIDKNDIVRDTKGQTVYFIDRDGRVVTTKGQVLGKAKKNGTYYNLKGNAVLVTKDIDKETCAILDPEGHNFGTVHKNYKLHACAAHCMFLKKQKEKETKKM